MQPAMRHIHSMHSMHSPRHALPPPPCIASYNIGGSAVHPEDFDRFRTGGAVPCCSDPNGKYDGSLDEAQTAYLLRARWAGGWCW
jgi:hypothetical protein